MRINPAEMLALLQEALRQGRVRVRGGQAGPAAQDGDQGAPDRAPVHHHPAERAAQGQEAGGVNAAAGRGGR